MVEYKVVFRNVGIALLLSAIFMALSTVVAAFNNFDSSFIPLLLSTSITTVVAILPLPFTKRGGEINLKGGFVIALFAWILSCIVGALPYLFWGGHFSLLNAWFESVSGYTTTGASILTDVEALPKGLLFWRSSTLWLGGMGVVLFMLLILPTVGTNRLRLSKVEISSLSRENFKFKVKEKVRIIAVVYLSLTLVETALLYLAGLNLFDSINLAFATISTGGFSTKNLSIASFDSAAVEIILMVFMLLSGIHYGLLYATFKGEPKSLLSSSLLKFFLITLIIGALTLSFIVKGGGGDISWSEAFREGFFQSISAVTTTGFATSTKSTLPPFSLLILLYFILQGSCAGSTTGGLRVDRVFIFFTSIKREVKKILHPNAVIPVKIDGHTLERESLNSVNLYITLYLFSIFFSAALLSATGMEIKLSLSTSAVTMGNVGFIPIEGGIEYHLLPPLSKVVLTFQMLLGRLEIYPFLLIFTIFRRRY
ncbi:MAG: TrkH family potassium uptake protein [Bacteroidales bacterium]